MDFLGLFDFLKRVFVPELRVRVVDGMQVVFVADLGEMVGVCAVPGGYS